MESNTHILSETQIEYICPGLNVNENWIRTGEGEMFIPSLLLRALMKLPLSPFEPDAKFLSSMELILNNLKEKLNYTSNDNIKE